MNPISFGFNTGAAQPQLSGAPGIKITGFDNLQNATPPSGRNDITGQATDSASWVVGRHQFRFSGEYRRGYVNEFYHRKTRGNFSFPGTQGPWGYVAGHRFQLRALPGPVWLHHSDCGPAGLRLQNQRAGQRLPDPFPRRLYDRLHPAGADCPRRYRALGLRQQRLRLRGRCLSTNTQPQRQLRRPL